MHIAVVVAVAVSQVQGGVPDVAEVPPDGATVPDPPAAPCCKIANSIVQMASRCYNAAAAAAAALSCYIIGAGNKCENGLPVLS